MMRPRRHGGCREREGGKGEAEGVGGETRENDVTTKQCRVLFSCDTDHDFKVNSPSCVALCFHAHSLLPSFTHHGISCQAVVPLSLRLVCVWTQVDL